MRSSRLCLSLSRNTISLGELGPRARFAVTGGRMHDEEDQSRLSMLTKGRTIEWEERPRTALILKKANTSHASQFLDTLARHLSDLYGIRSLVEPSDAAEFPHLATYDPADTPDLASAIDFVISLGGDGTLLRVSSLFPQDVPPVLSFAMGTVGFLVPFTVDEYRQALAAVFRGGFRFVPRMRLSAELFSGASEGPPMLTRVAMNEVALRGGASRLTVVDVEVNGAQLASYSADGVLVATSTGSTAYSLSCGGSAVHPGLHGMLVGPICPRQLSLRAALFPRSTAVRMTLSKRSREQGSVWFDGQGPLAIQREDSVLITQSPYPLPTISNKDPVVEWAHQLQRLGFGNAGNATESDE